MTRNEWFGGVGLALCVIDALIIWAALSGHAEFALRVLEFIVVWTIFALIAGYIVGTIIRTGRELEEKYEEENDDATNNRG